MSQEITDLYRKHLGRDPDQREMESELENTPKYGIGQLESNLKERAASTNHRPFDSQTTDPKQQAANKAADAGTYVPPNTPRPIPTSQWMPVASQLLPSTSPEHFGLNPPKQFSYNIENLQNPLGNDNSFIQALLEQIMNGKRTNGF